MAIHGTPDIQTMLTSMFEIEKKLKPIYMKVTIIYNLN